MKKVFLSFLFLAVFSAFSALAQKDISLEDIWTKGTFSAKGVAGFNSMNDGRYFCNLDERQNLLRFEFATGKVVDTLVLNQDIKKANGGSALDLQSFSWSNDESKLIIATQSEAIYRHSSQSIFYIYDLNTKTLLNPVKEKVR